MNNEQDFDFEQEQQESVFTDSSSGSVARHTRRVKIARIALPIIAFGLLGALLIAPFFSTTPVMQKHQSAVKSPQKDTEQTPNAATSTSISENNTGALQMTSPRFDGLDNKGRPFTITADKVVQEDGNVNSEMTLANPVADMLIKPEQSMALTANIGVYSQEKQSLDLNGDVSLFHDNGYNLTSQSMRIDLDKGNAETTDPAFLQGKNGSISGQGGIEFQDFGNHITFKGPAKLIILHTKKDSP